MSPTSYQTAPPRDLMIATVVGSVKRRELRGMLQASNAYERGHS